MSKVVIAITGGSGSGKTTQSKLLIDYLTDGNKESILQSKAIEKSKEDKLEYCFVLYPQANLAVIGKMGENQCTGLDSIYSKLGSDGVERSVAEALSRKEVNFVIIECLFFTYSWVERWKKSGLKNTFKLVFIHLEQTLFENFRRIQQRRWARMTSKGDTMGLKDWRDVPLEDTVYDNVGRKNGETRVIFQKVNGTHPKVSTKGAEACVQIQASLLELVILKKIVKAINSVL